MDESGKSFWREFASFLKFSFYVVQIWFCAAIFVMAKVWHHPLWHASLLRFLGRVWATFVAEQVGSTGPGFVNSLIAALVTLLLGGLGILYFQGWPAMKAHVIETIAMGIVVLFTVTFLVYGTQFAWEVAKAGYADHQELAAKASAPIPPCPVCPTCPTCSTPKEKGGGKPRVSLDIQCQNLADCPKGELSKRAIAFAQEVHDIREQYAKDEDGFTAKSSAIRDDQFDADAQRRSIEGQRKAAKRKAWESYTGISVDVTALRQVIQDRVGKHDHTHDWAYQNAASETFFGGYWDLSEIDAELRQLASEVLTTR